MTTRPDILLALGRTPNPTGIGLEKAGVEVTQTGHIPVNDRLETTASNVWAMGWRPWTISEKRGFMKTLIDAQSDRILGFTAFGSEAGELMGTVQLAMLAGLPYTILRDTMFAHPTMTEGLKALFMGVPQRLQDHAE